MYNLKITRKVMDLPMFLSRVKKKKEPGLLDKCLKTLEDLNKIDF